MGESTATEHQDEQQQRVFMRALLDDVNALERMLEAGLFEADARRIGAEQEIFLIDHTYDPAPIAEKVLAQIDDPSFTTELALFNLETNLPVYEFRGDCLSRMERELNSAVSKARLAARACGGDVFLTGILPTLQLEHLHLDAMTPVPRYRALNNALLKLRGGDFTFLIKGIDELNAVHDNILLEACSTSFQLHFQVGSDEFARLYNLAQAVTAPMLAAAVNSPVLLEKRLWHETRLALFQQSVDARSSAQLARGQRPRVTFGDSWMDDSVLEIFRTDIARFRVILAGKIDENPEAVLARGEIPELSALRLHNGTVYRWNRPCYGVHGGKPHLRIENRVIPAGPTVVDEVANAAFFFGLMTALGDEYGDITKVFSFDDARANFLAAARQGLKAQFTWVDGRSVAAADLVQSLIPKARTGLRSHGIDGNDVDRYLGVLEERVKSGRTGSQWALDSLAHMGNTGSRRDRFRILTRSALARQREGAPVHTWSLASGGEGHDWRHSYRTLGQYMTTDVFTMQPDDLIDLAAHLMDWEGIRHIPVEDNDGHLVGLVSHRMLLRALAKNASRGSNDKVAVRDIMKADPITATPETTTLDAIALMRRESVSCLPILKGERLIGMITDHDFMDAAAKLVEEQLRDFP